MQTHFGKIKRNAIIAADMSNDKSPILFFLSSFHPSIFPRLFISFFVFYFLPFYPSIFSFRLLFSFFLLSFFVASKAPPWRGLCGAISYVTADDICTELYSPIGVRTSLRHAVIRKSGQERTSYPAALPGTKKIADRRR